MDYIAVCKAFYMATGIPVTLLRVISENRATGDAINEVVFSALEDITAISAKREWDTFAIKENPVFCRQPSSSLEYGFLRIEGQGLNISIGPLLSIPVSHDIVREYMEEFQVPMQHQEKIAEILGRIPLASRSRHAWLLAFLNMVLNDQDFDVETLYDAAEQPQELLTRKAVAARQERIENERLHNSFKQEQQFYETVRSGNVARLDNFFKNHASFLREGHYAASPLRQAKNLFIITISNLVSHSAVPGGMDMEHASQLMDIYIQEYEQLTTVDAVYTLQYSMVRDFTNRIGRAKLPEGISAEMASAVEYIRSHINTAISTADLATHLGRSVSHVTHRFKEELGCSIGEYVNQCRMEEAVSLLAHSDMGISEISSYLRFSSQSYFQNVFKRTYGMTPMQYRRQAAHP